VSLLANIRNLLGRPPAAPGGPTVFLRRIHVECNVSVPANTPANASTVGTLTIDPKVGAVSQYTIPKNYSFRLVDAYIKASGDVGVDGIAKVKKNFFKDECIVGPVSTLLVSNPSRPTVAPATWSWGDTISYEYINIAAVGSSAVTVKFYLVFDVHGPPGG
jgi:hypothetical protein